MADIYESGCRHVLHAGCGITWEMHLWYTSVNPIRFLFVPSALEFIPDRKFDGSVALGFGVSGHVASKLYEKTDHR